MSRIKNVQAFLQEARDRYAFARSLDQEDRELALEDNRFAAALPTAHGATTQWDSDVAKARHEAARPILTENRLPTFTAQVVNDGRQRQPSIKISAMDGGKKETAEYLQGRIRQIEYDSNADIVYDTAREQQVTTGRGFLRVTTQYERHSFRQSARVERIQDQFSVVFGPAKEYDCSDAEYCFVVTHISKEEHARRFGKDSVAQQIDFAAGDDNPAPGWIGAGASGELMQIAEYWRKEHQKRTRVKLLNGEEAWKDELPPGAQIDQEREDDDVTVCQYFIDGAQIHDETEWLGPSIPIIPVWGRESYVDGKRRTASLIRHAKDPQRLLNLYVSNIAEQIGQMPKNPFRAPAGAIAGFETLWETINTEPHAVVYYNQFDENGREFHPPQREAVEPPIQALVIGYNQAVDSIKAAMGIYDASLGQRSNEVSGLAIQRRARESDNANAHFPGNEARSRKTLGKILMEILPSLDHGTGARAVRSEDGKTKMVRVGEPYRDEETGQTVHHDLSVGNYAAAVSSGPSYNSQRQEAAESYAQIAQADKSFMSVAGDLYFRNLDMPGADQIADRYERMLPPQLQAQKPGQQQIPQQVQQMLQQGKQMLQSQAEVIHKLQDALDSKQPEIQARIQIAQMQEETKRAQIQAEIRIAELNAGVKTSIAGLENQVSAIQHSIDSELAGRQQQQEQALADQQQEHEAGLQQSQQDHQAQLQASQQQQAPAQPEQPGEVSPSSQLVSQ